LLIIVALYGYALSILLHGYLDRNNRATGKQTAKRKLIHQKQARICAFFLNRLKEIIEYRRTLREVIV